MSKRIVASANAVYQFNLQEYESKVEGDRLVVKPVRGTMVARKPALAQVLGNTNVGGPKCEKVSAGAASAANERQIGGGHYKGKGKCRKCGVPTEHWDVVKMFNMPYMEARIFAYVLRWRDKAGLQDLEKAKHFIEKLIEQANEDNTSS